MKGKRTKDELKGEMNGGFKGGVKDELKGGVKDGVKGRAKDGIKGSIKGSIKDGVKDGKAGLKRGFTTGTCAAGAAGAAAAMLLTGTIKTTAQVKTPKGTVVTLRLLDMEIKKERVSCGVRKDAGDDPDVTHQTMIYASVEYYKGYLEEERGEERFYRQGNLFLTGGRGIGLITKPGLACPVGKHAINPVPRQMIFKEVEEAALLADFEGRLLVRISIPEGERLAAKTFNPRLGIVGGLSVLGTSGIVEPMSEAALKASIRLELHMKAVAGMKAIILTPGNYGERFLKENLGLSLSQGVRCSNYIGETVEMAEGEGLDGILFVGHMGKLIKVAGGVFNTHSKYGDRRMEILWDCTKGYCEDWDEEERRRLKERILGSNTTESATEALEEAGIRKPVMETVADRIREQIMKWHGDPVRVEAVVFSNGGGSLGMTAGALEFIRELRDEPWNDQAE